MKSLQEQLSIYKSVHLNKKNIATHFIGIPLIIGSIALLLTTFNFTLVLFDFKIDVTLTSVIVCCVLLYYAFQSVSLALLAVIFFGPVIYSAVLLSLSEHKLIIVALTFSIGWVLQFIGHGYEKAKPAFIDDVSQLFIGPLFLVAEIYFWLGFGKELAEKIEKKAIELRKLK
ncbi:DUF962 domain-containing protein [Colwelliaceae bacterium 6441]